jgi:2-polyprenyl-3-methyl-5-hydroxy-6-metoxy-1,4-benzoquinol methylase
MHNDVLILKREVTLRDLVEGLNSVLDGYDEIVRRRGPHRQTKRLLRRGGPDLERLYLEKAQIELSDGSILSVMPSKLREVDMASVIARHRGRYHLVAAYCRPGQQVLDVPCGSGYGREVLLSQRIAYRGIDRDPATVEYAQYVYGYDGAQFEVGDLTALNAGQQRYDVIACIEGIEHINRDQQLVALAALYKGLKPGGVLVISSPEASEPSSGRNPQNPFHECELTRDEFIQLLEQNFRRDAIEIASSRERLSTGEEGTCLFGICHK